ncbi:unnamed protein product [Somion occarium]|uniref:homogentisate 1,2-dioxygenase n=1 Tax=Somion occarium TaxID=3059160 RepID=A0ABP1CTJ9_9APHY
MEKKAFVNSDGDFLIMPEKGRLDIQTEMGKLMVRPGEMVVVQSGLKFKVSLPDGPSRGYVREIYAAHFELPELGPLGATGLADMRDFEHPIAGFDIDRTNWEIVYKITGQLLHANRITPLLMLSDGLEITCHHADPSSLALLTARSKVPGTPLVDICVIGPHWDVMDGYGPPYFHRNSACELITFVTVPSSGTFRPAFESGIVNYQTVFAPHGPLAAEHKTAVEEKLGPTYNYDGFIIEPSSPLLFTEFARKSPKFKEHDVALWKGLEPTFMKHVDQVNARLKAAGLPLLVQGN